MKAAEQAPVPDPELIRRWQGGDERAAAELVLRHTDALARFLAAAGAHQHELDDLVQEAFFRAFRGIDGFRARAKFRTWLLRIGSNVFKDDRRRQGRRAVRPLADDEEIPGGGDPHQEAVAEEVEARLKVAVQGLPPMQRDVFLLRAQQRLEYEEIAAALETSPGAARVHYHHAVRRLKEHLA